MQDDVLDLDLLLRLRTTCTTCSEDRFERIYIGI